MKWLALIALVALGCSDPAGSQYLPIGSRCSSDSQCGTSPFDCNMSSYPYGYCERPCTTDGDCPLDSLCSPAPVLKCRRACKDATDCRAAEGYACVALSTGKGVCEPSPATVDGGAP